MQETAEQTFYHFEVALISEYGRVELEDTMEPATFVEALREVAQRLLDLADFEEGGDESVLGEDDA